MSDEPIIRISARPPADGGVAQVRAKPRRLGRGLGALLGETQREEPLAVVSREAGAASATDSLAMLPIADIDPHPEQPRRHFDESALAELAASIAQRGVIQPIIVRRLGVRYQLIAGERRWRAAQRAQLHEIPALIRNLDDREVKVLALIENLQREDLNPIEEARAYQRLAETEGLTQVEIAGLVDKSRSHVANLQRLLTLPEAVIAMVEEGVLSMGHARALVGCDDAQAVAQDAVRKQLSVRAVEQLLRKQATARELGAKPRTAEASNEGNADILAVQAHLEEFLGLPVRISSDADPRSGAVTIRYATLDQLDLVCQRLTGGGI